MKNKIYVLCFLALMTADPGQEEDFDTLLRNKLNYAVVSELNQD